MEMKTKVEIVTCGEDGLATNEGEVLLHGELGWGEGHLALLAWDDLLIPPGGSTTPFEVQEEAGRRY